MFTGKVHAYGNTREGAAARAKSPSKREAEVESSSGLSRDGFFSGEATDLSITVDSDSRQKSDQDSALFQQSQEFMRRHDALSELYRIGRRAKKLFRKLDHAALEPVERVSVEDELKQLESRFHETLAQGNLELVSGGGFRSVAPQKDLPVRTTPISQGGPRIDASSSSAADRLRASPEPRSSAPVSGSTRLSESELLVSTLEEMMEREASMLAEKIKSSRTGALPGSGLRLQNPVEATALAEELQVEIVDTGPSAVDAAIHRSFNPERIFQLLEP